jgi:hypothetical protein
VGGLSAEGPFQATRERFDLSSRRSGDRAFRDIDSGLIFVLPGSGICFHDETSRETGCYEEKLRAWHTRLDRRGSLCKTGPSTEGELSRR